MQQVSNVEFYTLCADVRIVGTSQSPTEALMHISPLVTISGTEHLPADASAYRKAYDGEFGDQYLVGPAVATYSGASRPATAPSPSPQPPPPSPPPSSPSPPPKPTSPALPPYVATQLHPSGSSWSGTASVDLSLSRLDEFVSSLTDTVAQQGTYGVRAVHSSGGAAGGVVSEGQGYGLMLAGIVAASLPNGHARRPEMIGLAYEFFLGWRRMCERTAVNSCQDTHMCGPNGEFECLPSWKFDSAITAEVGTGSAPDGDEDAILGMVFLVLAAEQEAAAPAWLGPLTQWTYQSCRAFLEHLSVPHATLKASNGVPLRALKLGSCWGG